MASERSPAIHQISSVVSDDTKFMEELPLQSTVDHQPTFKEQIAGKAQEFGLCDKAEVLDVTLEEKSPTFKEQMADKAFVTKEQMAEKAQFAKEQMVETAHVVADKAQLLPGKMAETAHVVADKAHLAGEQMGETAHVVADKAHLAKEQMVETVHVVADKAHLAGEQMAETAHVVADKAQLLPGKMAEMAHVVADKAHLAGEQMAETAHVVADKAQETAHVVADKAHLAKEQMVETAHVVADKAHIAKEQMVETAHVVADKASIVGEQIAEKAVAAKEFMTEKAEDAKHMMIGAANTVTEKLAHACVTEENLGGAPDLRAADHHTLKDTIVEKATATKEVLVGKATATKDFVADKVEAAHNVVAGAEQTVGEKVTHVTAKAEAKFGPQMETIRREVIHAQGVCTRAMTTVSAALAEHAKLAAESLREQQREMQDAKHDFAEGTKRSPFPYCSNVHCSEYAPCQLHEASTADRGDIEPAPGTWAFKVKEEAQHVKEVLVNATAEAAEMIAEKAAAAKIQYEEQQRIDAAHFGKDYLPR